MAGKFEVLILMGVFIIIAGCFSIPIIIYATSSQDTAASTNAALKKLVENFDVNKCPQQPVSMHGYNFCIHLYTYNT